MSSDSLFAEYLNAVLVFQIGTLTYQEDPCTGNEYPVTQPLTVEAMLRQVTKFSKDQVEFPGADRTFIQIKGRSIEPMYLPSVIQAGARAICTITDPESGHIQTGDFEITAILQSPFTIVTEVLGSKFYGTFKLNNTGEAAYA